jgi:hypothetical protein
MIWLERGLVVSPVYYALVVTQAQFEKALKSLNIEKSEWPPFMKTSHANATTHFFTKSTGEECAIVCMPKKLPKGVTKLQAYALLVHEAVHIWQAIKDYLGERDPSKEFEAYSVQRIAQSLMFAYEELRHE